VVVKEAVVGVAAIAPYGDHRITPVMTRPISELQALDERQKILA
jgi:hypothetical protein